jgi:hypothetical protein
VRRWGAEVLGQGSIGDYLDGGTGLAGIEVTDELGELEGGGIGEAGCKD